MYILKKDLEKYKDMYKYNYKLLDMLIRYSLTLLKENIKDNKYLDNVIIEIKKILHTSRSPKLFETISKLPLASYIYIIGFVLHLVTAARISGKSFTRRRFSSSIVNRSL